MDKFRFWAAIVISSILGLVGFFLAGPLELPNPTTLNQTRFLYSCLGILIGLLTFPRIVGWIVGTSARVTRNIMSKLASEIANQFTQITSRTDMSRSKADINNTSLDEEMVASLSGAVILDTSSIIDGRILDVVKTGFLNGLILIPHFVLAELRQVSDSADDLKRKRGRRGFDIVDDLQKVKGVKVVVWEKDVVGKTVDDKLLRLSRIIHGRILTCDFNLNRAGRVSGVTVLNLNELTNALKNLPIPGETMSIKIVHPGKDREQGVGYLTDGTMVVVKEGATVIGQETKIEVTKLLQGPSGRMIFGKILPS